MKKYLYQHLTDFLLTKLPKRYQPNFYSWMATGKILDEGVDVTDHGIEVCHIKYEAVLWFEALPFNDIDPSLIMALIKVWLNENDPFRQKLDLVETEIDLDMLDDNTADLSFTVHFQEPITAIESEKGELVIRGKSYRLAEIPIDYVNEIDLGLKIES